MLGIDPQNTTVKAVYKHWEDKVEERRPYIGASVIGTECTRKLWLAFRWCFQEEFPGRILRLFNRGHREEPVFIKELEAIGCQVEGTQHEEVAHNGHFKMHCDGVVKGLIEAPETWHVIDFKTMGEKSFKRFTACKTAEEFYEEFPEYYGQLQVEMELMKLDRAALLAVNKNTDDLHLLRMKRDAQAGKYFLERAGEVISAQAPEACERNASDFRCRFCAAHPLCFGGTCAEVNCRNCCYSTPVENGKWTCADRDDEVLSMETLQHGCQRHIFVPGVLAWKMEDYGDGWVLYENGVVNAGDHVELPDTLEFVAQVTSQELHRHFADLRDGKTEELFNERNCFPQRDNVSEPTDGFTDVEPEVDARRQELLDLIEQGDENAKADFFKEYGQQQT